MLEVLNRGRCNRGVGVGVGVALMEWCVVAVVGVMNGG